MFTLLISPHDVLIFVCQERSCLDWPGWPMAVQSSERPDFNTVAVSIPLVRLLHREQPVRLLLLEWLGRC